LKYKPYRPSGLLEIAGSNPNKIYFKTDIKILLALGISRM
jgi:hypothetical protein